MAETYITTGLIAVASNQPVGEKPGTAVAYVPSDQPLSAQKLARLAQELVMAIRDPLIIYREYGLTEQQFKTHIELNEYFKRAHEAYTIEWNSTTSTTQRLRLQSQAMMEDNLPGFAARMRNEHETLPAVVQAATLLAKIGGIGEDKQQVHPGERFTITINLGADTQQFNKTVGALPVIDVEATPVMEKPDEKLSPQDTLLRH